MHTNEKTVAKILFIVAVLCGLSALSLADVVAGNGPSPLIIFDGSKDFSTSSVEFGTVYRGPVHFTHGRHINEHAVSCGKCHHDDSGEPINDLEFGDGVDTCTDCHYEETLLRGKALEGMSQEEVIEHYPNAMHELCISCHKEMNNKTHTLSAPEACRSCHGVKK